eukprot:GHVO01003867.1.p1 GENE.GHVO01003867.1~~GHVO01003867.1.p1  ORF type:complete len:544 (+),score=122.98 GHVO01003867.1:84-1634(+)
MSDKKTDGGQQQRVAAKELRKAAREAEAVAARAALDKRVTDVGGDDVYGQYVVDGTRTERVWTNIKDINGEREGEQIWLRARLHEIRMQGSALAFLALRQKHHTIQSVFAATAENKAAIKWIGNLTRESVIDVQGTIKKPAEKITSTTQSDVEVTINRIYCVSKCAPVLPFQLHDANRPEHLAAEAVRVNQDVRLDNRVLDLRTYSNQAIFRVQSETCQLFREFLLKESFTEIHSPKLLAGQSEGGSSVFKFSFFGREGCLAQSPQLYKQMALCGDMDRVFEIGPVFRAENSNTHRHLCEFMGLDFEMTIKESYHEVLDVVNGLFKSIFEGLNTRCKEEIALIREHFPASEFKWIGDAPRLTYEEGMALLKEAGEDIPDWRAYDMGTEAEKRLGAVVKEKYGTDFYMLHRYPIGFRPFYTSPAGDDPTLTDSYDIFMRGEEIISGAMRIYDADLLAKRATECGVDSVQAYLDAFRLGAYPHGGVGVGLERVVMLFLGLPNIRKVSLFPRDPKRLSP